MVGVEDIVAGLDDTEAAATLTHLKWFESARAGKRAGKQLLPDPSVYWEILIWRAGRGFGKTLAITQAMWWEMWRLPNMIGHYLAPTKSDVRGTIFEGPAGLCSIIPPECLYKQSISEAYNKSTHEISLSNGSIVKGYATTEEAQRLRGPQCHFLGGDELAAWDRPAGNLELAFTNAMLGCRLPYPDGTPARAVFGTTPTPIPFLKRLEKRKGVIVVRGSSHENLDNLSASYRATIMSLEGTAIGRQEIYGDYIDEENDLSIFKRSWIKLWPADKKLPEFSFVIECYDTAMSDENFDVKRQRTDPTGYIVLGVFNIPAVFSAEERKKMGLRSRYGIVLCEAWSERLGFPDLLEKARSQHRIKWGSPGRRADIVLIEQKGSGISLRQTLLQYGVPTWPYNPGRMNKSMRAHAVSPLVQQGMLFVPESTRADRKGLPRDWVEPFLEQICSYAGPGSVEHDDYLDCLSSGLLYLRDRDMLKAEPNEIYADYEEKLDQDREEAKRQYSASKSRKQINPYG